MSKGAQHGKSKLPEGYAHGHIGAATKTREYEDRHYFGTIETAAGLKLTLAIVADGVGGGKLGQRAAQLTIDTIVSECRNSKETEIPRILGSAIGKANRAVYREAHKYSDREGMSATVAIAAIHNKRLYVANVGDSRVYLLRGRELRQVTVDHTWANEHIRSGKLSRSRALNHPNADLLARSVGYEPRVRVDLGLYLDDSESGEEAYSNQGLPLGPNDVVLVCSDGLIKPRRDGPGHYVEEDEIIRVLSSGTPEQAAKTLVDLALGRNVDDNVTAVVVTMPGRKPRFRLPLSLTPMFTVFVSAAICVVGTFAAWMLLRSVPQSTSVIPSPTPPPTLTPHPTPPPNYAYLSVVDGSTISQVQGHSIQIVHSGNIVPFQSGSLLRVERGLTTFNTPGNFLVQALGSPGHPTIVELFQAADPDTGLTETVLKLQEGRILVVGGGNTASGIRFAVDTVWGRAVIMGTIMGGRYDPVAQVFDVDCLTGHCVVETRTDSVNLSGGEHVRLNAGGGISPPDGVDYSNYAGFNLAPFITPTPVPTPSPESKPSSGYGSP